MKVQITEDGGVYEEVARICGMDGMPEALNLTTHRL